MEINSYILKISGNAELPSELILGDNYKITIEGTVVKSQDSDNHNGTLDRMYTIKPIMVELVDNKGESIKARDTRSESQLFRGLLKKKWIEKNIEMEFETFYSLVYKRLYKYLDAIINEI
jgi:hypothetical protein